MNTNNNSQISLMKQMTILLLCLLASSTSALAQNYEKYYQNLPVEEEIKLLMFQNVLKI